MQNARPARNTVSNAVPRRSYVLRSLFSRDFSFLKFSELVVGSWDDNRTRAGCVCSRYGLLYYVVSTKNLTCSFLSLGDRLYRLQYSQGHKIETL